MDVTDPTLKSNKYNDVLGELKAYAMFTQDTFTWGKCIFTIENVTQYNRNVNLPQVNVSCVNVALVSCNPNKISAPNFSIPLLYSQVSITSHDLKGEAGFWSLFSLVSFYCMYNLAAHFLLYIKH